MIRHNDKSVREIFDSTSIEWASPSFANRVLYVPVSSDREVTKQCASVLSSVELQRAERFTTDDGREQFIQRRAFRRYCGALASESQRPLSEILFHETENGRPWLHERRDLSFSFSSCRSGFVGAWSSTHDVGIDLEDEATMTDVVQLAWTYFTESEAQAVENESSKRRQRFLQFWSLKEAALKSIGEGLPFGMHTFEFALEGGVRILDAPREHGGPAEFKAHLFDHINIFSAIVARRLR